MMLMLNASAQRVRYKDIVPTIIGAPDDEALARLKEYLLTDLDNPNANLRVALIHQRAYKRADPLIQYDKVLAHAEAAKLRFLKVRTSVNDSEIRKNDELYVDLAPTIDGRGRQVTDAAKILNMIRNGYDSAELIIKNLPLIYNNFTRSVDNYNRAIRIFADVCGAYSSLSDLYLLYDNDLKSKLSSLKQHYDSSIWYFDRYRDAIKTYPLNKYNQRYEIKPIKTYRLEGLITQMNFLENNLIFWDYGKWADEINQVMATELNKLRQDIEANEKKISAALQEAATKPVAGFEPVKLDKQTMFNLKKYDYQSLVAALLEYKQFKQVLTNKLQSENYFEENKSLDNQRVHTFYSEIINNTRYADSLLNIVRERNTDDKFLKHTQFLNTYYAGKPGLNRFMETESADSRKNFTLYVGRLRGALISDFTKPADARPPIRHRNLSIALNPKPSSPDSISSAEVLTMNRQNNADGSFYLSGVHRPDKKNNNLVAFVARVAADGRLAWFKEYNFSTAQNVLDNIPAALASTREGCAFTIYTRSQSEGIILNKLIYIDEKGEEKFSKDLDVYAYPRKINYKEDNNTFVIVLKGGSYSQDIRFNEEVNLIGYNTLGDLLWKRNFEMAGTFEDLVNIQQGYLFVANYTIFKDAEGKTYRTRINDGQTNAVLLRLSERGDQRNIRLINTEKSFHIGGIYKVNDTCINLLGWTGNYGLQGSSEPDIHIITDSTLRLINSNL